MNLRFILILVFVFAVGFGGKFTYDAYQQRERQERLEQMSAAGICSFCSLVKQDMKQLRDDIEQERVLSGEQPE